MRLGISMTIRDPSIKELVTNKGGNEKFLWTSRSLFFYFELKCAVKFVAGKGMIFEGGFEICLPGLYPQKTWKLNGMIFMETNSLLTEQNSYLMFLSMI